MRVDKMISLGFLILSSGCEGYYYHPVSATREPLLALGTAMAVTDKTLASDKLGDIEVGIEVLSEWIGDTRPVNQARAHGAGDGLVSIVKRLELGWPGLKDSSGWSHNPQELAEQVRWTLDRTYRSTAALARTSQAALGAYYRIKPSNFGSSSMMDWEAQRVRYNLRFNSLD